MASEETRPFPKTDDERMAQADRLSEAVRATMDATLASDEFAPVLNSIIGALVTQLGIAIASIPDDALRSRLLIDVIAHLGEIVTSDAARAMAPECVIVLQGGPRQ